MQSGTLKRHFPSNDNTGEIIARSDFTLVLKKTLLICHWRLIRWSTDCSQVLETQSTFKGLPALKSAPLTIVENILKVLWSSLINCRLIHHLKAHLSFFQMLNSKIFAAQNNHRKHLVWTGDIEATRAYSCSGEILCIVPQLWIS